MDVDGQAGGVVWLSIDDTSLVWGHSMDVDGQAGGVVWLCIDDTSLVWGHRQSNVQGVGARTRWPGCVQSRPVTAICQWRLTHGKPVVVDPGACLGLTVS